MARIAFGLDGIFTVNGMVDEVMSLSSIGCLNYLPIKTKEIFKNVMLIIMQFTTYPKKNYNAIYLLRTALICNRISPYMLD